MGCYDTINIAEQVNKVIHENLRPGLPLPRFTDYQTKDLDCLLYTYEIDKDLNARGVSQRHFPDGEIEIYTCGGLGEFIEFNISVESGKLRYVGFKLNNPDEGKILEFNSPTSIALYAADHPSFNRISDLLQHVESPF